MNDEVVNAERNVIGAILLHEDVIDEVSEILQPGDFSSLVAETLYGALLKMRADGLPIDLTTVADYTRNDELIRRNGGALLLHHLHADTPTWTNASYYAAIVAREAVARRLEAAYTRGLQLIQGRSADFTPLDVAEIVNAEALAASRPGSGVLWASSGIDEWRSALDEPVTYTPTPWPDLNRLIGGWSPGRFYIIAARPSVGKSMASLQAAMDLARHGSVALCSLEMGLAEIQDRMVANLADVTLDAIQSHRLTSDERLRIDAALDEVRQMHLAVDDRVNLSPTDISAYARTIARRGPLAGVLVDYVQLMDGDKASRQEEVADASRQLKLLSKSLEIPVIALSQLNRATLQNGNRVPHLGNLRDSGALEQDADVVILMSAKTMKDPATGEEFEHPTELLVEVAKNRSGKTGRFTLVKEGEYARIKNPAPKTMGVPGYFPID